ncbi:4-oxalocrotonate tautomerase [Aquincola sp. S2]|uniref:4-oxalocrotonate tautomerase n=1 Tax=Pseudaquabacterium terrae TaxID=2732868 RepID=A0ABX2E9C3_9BURK|nr:4-oxalocrotonate tautomerase [Aquabacterium terrae]NRF65556.1 4-oxalocrotonate tautomerase [Aquabacterium terrae]
MPTIHVELFEGRTVAQKAALAKEITEACVRVLGGSGDAVDVIFRDVARHDWATGGRLWSERSAGAPAPAAGSTDPA